MAIFATAGSKIFIGGPLDTQSDGMDAADFASQSWIEIGWAEAIGEFGDESSEITFDAIGEVRRKLKGTQRRHHGGPLRHRPQIGQIALRAAESVPTTSLSGCSSDAPVGGNPSQRYFVAKVMTARVADTANNVVASMPAWASTPTSSTCRRPHAIGATCRAVTTVTTAGGSHQPFVSWCVRSLERERGRVHGSQTDR
jgi:hypothetical protein